MNTHTHTKINIIFIVSSHNVSKCAQQNPHSHYYLQGIKEGEKTWSHSYTRITHSTEMENKLN